MDESLDGFVKWWETWPRNVMYGYSRKAGKSMCLEVWQRKNLEKVAELIIRHTEYQKGTADWQKDQGSFIPMPITYLRQQRWDGADIPESASAVPEQTQQYLQELSKKKATPMPEHLRKLRAV
jgi:hypothetical protein